MGGHMSHESTQSRSKKVKLKIELAGAKASAAAGNSPKQQGKYRREWRERRAAATSPDRLAPSTIEETAPSPAAIRHQKLLQLRDERPTLTDQDRKLVLDTWDIVHRDSENLGFEVFNSLFATYPDTKGAFLPFKTMSAQDERFNEELRHHGRKVMDTVAKVLANSNDEDALVLYLQDLGSRHITFNAKPDYFDLIGPQFLQALEPLLKDSWSPGVEQAWANLFKLMTHIMREAMMI